MRARSVCVCSCMYTLMYVSVYQKIGRIYVSVAEKGNETPRESGY